jgi:hypothetical protein
MDSEGISVKMLKNVAIEISTPLSHIFNLSLKKGIFPSKLKTSKIVPIHKGGNAELCENYRPIALLSSISKTLEKIVAIRLTNHLEIHKLLSPCQFGFQRGKNTEHNLIRVVTEISNRVNNGEYCMGIFLDLRKAFDVCSHDVLIRKLRAKGVNGVALEWFKNYLNNRTQIVELNGQKSAKTNIDLSVIQ